MVASAQATALGFPDEQRATLWLEGSGGATLRRDSPRSYAELAAAGMDEAEAVIDPESLEHINMDIPRTATVHPKFELAPECSELDRGDRSLQELAEWLVTAMPEEESLVVPLLRVLSAMCVRSPQRGYTQGMNFVAAVLLLHVPEEVAFWCLAGVQDILIPQVWDEPTRIGRVVELQLLDNVLSSANPRLFERLRCIDSRCFATGWVDTLFAGNWPSDVATRCLDGLLCSKYPAALQRIVLAYLESIEHVIVPESSGSQPVAEASLSDPFEMMMLMQSVKDGPPAGWVCMQYLSR